MQKIKIITDSACDLSPEIEKELDIKIFSFIINLDGKEYRERIDFDNQKFYDMMDSTDDMPKTAQITSFEFFEIFTQYYKEGYTDLVYVSISSTGSNTNNSANMAKKQFFEENPEAKMTINIVDSLNYSANYGYPVMQAASKVKKGASVDEIVAYLEDWFASVTVLFSPTTLKYAKKSGRISSAAAFAGEILGLKPIIEIVDGVSYVREKVRGEKAIIPKLLEMMEKKMIPQTPYSIIYGDSKEKCDELEQAVIKKFGYPPELKSQVGAAVASNAGHSLVGIVIKEEKRR